jgi:hypothetical protein
VSNPIVPPKTQSRQARRPRYRTLREDYVQFCDGNTVAALLLDYFASADHIHDEHRVQGETPSDWRAVSGRFGGLITILQPSPTRDTIRRALDKLTEKGLIEAHSDNGQRAEPNTTSVPNRYRLIAFRLLAMEREWTPGASDAGGDFQNAPPPAFQKPHESEEQNQIIHDALIPEPNHAVQVLARFYESKSGKMIAGWARRDLDSLVEDFPLAEIEAAIKSTGDRPIREPFSYLRRVLMNVKVMPAPEPAVKTAAGSFWGRDLTDGE